MINGKLRDQSLGGSQDLQLIPLVIRYAAGVPSIRQNPTNEAISLTDVGTGEVTVTLADPGLAPLIVAGIGVRPSAPNTAGANATLKGATTNAAFTVVVNADADGTTETDPVDLHLMIVKQVAA